MKHFDMTIWTEKVSVARMYTFVISLHIVSSIFDAWLTR